MAGSNSTASVWYTIGPLPYYPLPFPLSLSLYYCILSMYACKPTIMPFTTHTHAVSLHYRTQRDTRVLVFSNDILGTSNTHSYVGILNGYNFTNHATMQLKVSLHLKQPLYAGFSHVLQYHRYSCRKGVRWWVVHQLGFRVEKNFFVIPAHRPSQ